MGSWRTENAENPEPRRCPVPRRLTTEGLLLAIAKGQHDFTDGDLRGVDVAGHPNARRIFAGAARWSETLLIGLRQPEALRDALDRHRTEIERQRFFFTQSDLSGANLRGLPLPCADFRLTFLDGTDLSGCMLTGATFRDAKAPSCRFAGADLRCAELAVLEAQSADFSKAWLAGADLRQSRMARAGFVGADLAGSDVDEASLMECDFTDATLRGARNLGGAVWRGAVFKRTVVTAAERRAITSKRSADSLDGTGVELRALRESAGRPR